MNWLNLCSGGEIGRQAVKELGLEVTNWFTSEIDKFAIKVANDNHDDLQHLGDICTVYDYFDKIDSQGGVISCIENGFLQKEIADASSDYNKKIESQDRIVVGVNDYVKEDEKIDIPILKISKTVEDKQIQSLEDLKIKRDSKKVKQKL